MAKRIHGFFFCFGIYVPDDTEVSFLIQCSRAHQWTLRLVGVREPDVLHDFYIAVSTCLATSSVLCRYAAAGCVIHRVGHLGTLVWGWGVYVGGGDLGSAQPVLSLPPGAIKVTFCSPPPPLQPCSIFVYGAGTVNFKGAPPPPERIGPVGPDVPPKNGCVVFIPA